MLWCSLFFLYQWSKSFSGCVFIKNNNKNVFKIKNRIWIQQYGYILINKLQGRHLQKWSWIFAICSRKTHWHPKRIQKRVHKQRWINKCKFLNKLNLLIRLSNYEIDGTKTQNLQLFLVSKWNAVFRMLSGKKITILFFFDFMDIFPKV